MLGSQDTKISEAQYSASLKGTQLEGGWERRERQASIIKFCRYTRQKEGTKVEDGGSEKLQGEQ